MNENEVDGALAAYYVAIAAAWKEYETAWAPLWRAYEEAKAEALKALAASREVSPQGRGLTTQDNSVARRGYPVVD